MLMLESWNPLRSLVNFLAALKIVPITVKVRRQAILGNPKAAFLLRRSKTVSDLVALLVLLLRQFHMQ